jgi:hypothetical protein
MMAGWAANSVQALLVHNDSGLKSWIGPTSEALPTTVIVSHRRRGCREQIWQQSGREVPHLSNTVHFAKRL